MQGDVESVASKNPRELTNLLEQISGSEEFKRRYEELEEEKARAEEKKALAYQKKKTVNMERKQKKEQKEEAEKHLRLQEQLVSVLIYMFWLQHLLFLSNCKTTLLVFLIDSYMLLSHAPDDFAFPEYLFFNNAFSYVFGWFMNCL